MPFSESPTAVRRVRLDTIYKAVKEKNLTDPKDIESLIMSLYPWISPATQTDYRRVVEILLRDGVKP